MNGDENSELPESWSVAPLQGIADINPKLNKSAYTDDLEVSFVPMPAVEAETAWHPPPCSNLFGRAAVLF